MIKISSSAWHNQACIHYRNIQPTSIIKCVLMTIISTSPAWSSVYSWPKYPAQQHNQVCTQDQNIQLTCINKCVFMFIIFSSHQHDQVCTRSWRLSKKRPLSRYYRRMKNWMDTHRGRENKLGMLKYSYFCFFIQITSSFS